MGAPPLRTERASNLMPKGRARDGGGIEPPDRRPPQSANPPRRRFPPSTYRPAVAGGIQWASNAACEPSRSPQDAFSGLGDSPYLHPADSAVPAIHSLAVRGRPVCRISTDLTARRLLVWCPRLESNPHMLYLLRRAQCSAVELPPDAWEAPEEGAMRTVRALPKFAAGALAVRSQDAHR